MTGWQSGGGGDQGGWNPNQSFGPEAGTNRYGADPYAQQQPDPYQQQYGANPYGGAAPYGGEQQQQPYGYDQYGQYQQFPPTGGFPAAGYGAPPPPPPKRSKLPMILSLVAIVIIIGAVVAILLVNRKDNQPVAQDDNKSSTAPKDTTGKSTPNSKSSSPSTKGGEHGDWLSIDNTADSGLSYQVPSDWKQSNNPVKSGLGVDFTGAADYGNYDCEGAGYVRTFAASGDVQGKDGKDLDLATTVEDFAKSFATTYYGEDAQVDVPTPTDTKVDGKTAMTVTAKVKQNVTAPNCQASDGEVSLVGVLLETDGQPKGVAMMVVVNDLNGGPADPKALDPSLTQEILATVKAG
ncbi:hypothetical protein [Actinophytocola oryzae]|uniref:DUF8017 domain-containing protein n=1 Tax=Actinophytocola oryzae TaxID=502181 RepID=A0A4R7VPD7_9PSEU|nr:hypothetical protein [Actinophytocola oryzae]TDV51077.1 hypothetical protein CLV71_106428 [Actinophytocola oryzae]